MSLTDIPHYGAETQTHTNITFNGDYATQQCTICSLATTWQKGKLHGEKPLISSYPTQGKTYSKFQSES